MDKTRLYIVIALLASIIFSFASKIYEYDGLFWLFFLSMIASIAALFLYSSTQTKTVINTYAKETDDYITSNNINVSKSIFSDTGSSRLLLDHEKENLYILKYNKIPTSIPYSQIKESELIENGNTLTKTSRGSQLGGVLVGGVLAGGVGAVIGGLSSNKVSSDSVKEIEIKIITDDIYSPVHSFFVKDSVEDFDKTSPNYKQVYDTAYKLQKIVSLIIENQEKKLSSAL